MKISLEILKIKKLMNDENLKIMYHNLFPITIIDDFYPQPDIIRNFALSQSFDPPTMVDGQEKEQKILIYLTWIYTISLLKAL